MFSFKTLAMGVAAAAATVALAQPASAAWVLTNDNGGDGYVVGAAPSFDLFGSDNQVGANTTSYLDTAVSGATLKVDWTYTTADCCGAFFDPAGYFSSPTGQIQLSPSSSAPGYTGSGSFIVHINPGDVYGFYVFSADSELGRADIAVNLSAYGVPEPATWALMLSGFGMVGYALRRREKLAVA